MPIYEGIPELFDYAIRLTKLKSVHGSLDIVTFHLLDELVHAAKRAIEHYFILTLQEPFLQNSHFGSPYKKWAAGTNDNFKSVVASIIPLITVVEELYYDAAKETSDLTAFDGFKLATIWLRKLSKEYDCCVVKPGNHLALSTFDLQWWIDPKTQWFRVVSMRDWPPVVELLSIDISDRAVLDELKSTGQGRVNQMWASLESFAGWLRKNCTIEDVAALRKCVENNKGATKCINVNWLS